MATPRVMWNVDIYFFFLLEIVIYHCAQVEERKHGAVPVSKLCTAVVTILLLLSAKEVETNAGPTHGTCMPMYYVE